MTLFALALILASAVIHATWNLLVKRAGGGSLFVWAFTTLSSIGLVPAAVITLVVTRQPISAIMVGFVVGTSIIHLFYFVLLQRAYALGDLSLVYPLARGLGPLLATFGAISLLGERPSALALLGLVLVLTGVVLLALPASSPPSSGNAARQQGDHSSRPSPARSAFFYGTLTGVVTAVYTVWDKYAVARLEIPPLVLEAFAGCGVSLMLAPHAYAQWPRVLTIWRDHKWELVAVAVLAPLSYILVLTAMSFTALSYVAPCREISILFAALFGSRWLGEDHSLRRLTAAGSMVAGVFALALG